MTIDPERIGELADRVDSLVCAESLPFPEAVAKPARTQSLTKVRDDLRAIFKEMTGEDPWEI